VLHGASSVPQEEVRRINVAGGALDSAARGVDADLFRRAAVLGVAKVNVDTDGRLVWTRVHREYFRDHPEEFDFRKPGQIFVEQVASFIAQKAEKLGAAGQLTAVRHALVSDYDDTVEQSFPASDPSSSPLVLL
jgi:fructose-bisphosphate aldolase class II